MTIDQLKGVINISPEFQNLKNEKKTDEKEILNNYTEPIKDESKNFKSKNSDESEKNYVNFKEEDQMEIFGFRKYLPYSLMVYILCILTFGILRLLFHWKPHWMLKCTHIKCSLSESSKVMLIDHYNQVFVEDVHKVDYSQLKKNSHFNYSTFKDSTVSDSNNFQVKNILKNVANLELIKTDGKEKFEPGEILAFFMNKRIKYIWDEKLNLFIRVKGIDNSIPCSYFYSHDGLSVQDQENRRYIYGLNEINVEVQSILQILFNEILGPFYVFQVFSILIWSSDNYYYYASCIVAMSTISLATSVVQIRKNQKQLRDTVRGLDNVTVCLEGNRFVTVDSTKLVPGDIIVIPSHGCIMQCDAVLISGNVIVNESMLTGESVPVTKTPISTEHDEFFDVKQHGKHILYGGTNVIQTRFYNGALVKAMVIRTGFLTSKGELVRSILFPKPVDFQFNRHIYRFIHCLAVIALCGFIYTVILKMSRKVPLRNIIIKAIDLITIIIPPALPAAMTVGVVYAQSRLKKQEIFCISPRSINISGCLNCICFDKTGTLTEDDLSFAQILPVNLDTVTYGSSIENPSCLETYNKLIGCLTTCHSLTLIDNKLIGDPLDQKMFEATNWSLEEPEINDTNKFDLLAPTVVKSNFINIKNENVEIGILKQFQFSSSLQRMSVITRKLDDQNYVVFSKGAPETIFSLCNQNSLPKDVYDRLHDFTEKGYRVLALATRDLHLSFVKMQKLSREETEKDLIFLGLLVMGNMLKPETKDVINVLKQANIRPVMVTGDNMLTALSVSRECDMINSNDQVILLEIDEENSLPNHHKLKWKFASQPSHIKSSSLEQKDQMPLHNLHSNNINEICLSIEKNLHIAITGKTFSIIRDEFPENFLEQIAIRGTVFARMSPDQKQQLIELLQSVDYYVGMCGDGANDCGALKAAHAGVSLSETEASVASPFTSKKPNISCIPKLIQEGRASLVTAFGILKYMACYSLTQFLSVIILYTFYSNLTDWEFLYIDLFLISVFFVFFGRTEAYSQLAKKPPPSSLIGLVPLLSIALQLFLIISCQLIAVFLIQRQPWYKPHEHDDDNLTGHDNYAIFAASVFQYISLAVIFSKGKPYRKAIYTNYCFLLSVVVMTCVTIYIILYPHEIIQKYLELNLSEVPIKFRLILVIMALINFILAFICESFVVDYIIFHKIKSSNLYKKFETSKPFYEEINKQTKNNIEWLEKTINSSKGIINKAFQNSNNLKNTEKNLKTNSDVSLVSNYNSTVDLISRGCENDSLNQVSYKIDNEKYEDRYLNQSTLIKNSSNTQKNINLGYHINKVIEVDVHT